MTAHGDGEDRAAEEQAALVDGAAGEDAPAGSTGTLLETGNGAGPGGDKEDAKAAKFAALDADPDAVPLPSVGGSGKDKDVEAAAEEEAVAPRASVREIAIAIFSLSLGMAVGALDMTIVSTMLPTISRDLDGADTYSWVATGYLLTSTALSPVWGGLSDIFGRKRLLLFGLAWFMAFSAMCAAANTMLVLIVGRVLQGLGGGALMSLTMVVVGEIVAPRERGKYMGIMIGVTGVCSIVGPLLGGVITDRLNWRWGFWINLPVGAVAMVGYIIALKLPPPTGSLRQQFARVDYAGVLLSCASVTLLLLAFTWGGSTYPWGSGQVVGCIVGALALLAAFLYWETKAREPVVPLSLFRNRNYVIVNIVMFLIGFIMYASMYFIPLYFQEVLGLSPTDSGIRQIPMTAAFIPTAIGIGVVISKTGRYHFFPIFGMLLVGGACLWISFLDQDSALYMMFLPQVLMGLGFGSTMSTAQLVAQTNAPDTMIGPATTVSNFIRNLGGVVGIAVFATVFANVSAAEVGPLLGAAVRKFGLTPAQLQAFRESLAAAYGGRAPDLSSIPPDALAALVSAVRESFVRGLHWSFIAAVPVCGLGFLVALGIRHVPLRKTAAVRVNAE